MANDLTITDFSVTTRQGSGNGQPVGGWVTFSDGKFYSWGLDIEKVDGTYQTVDKVHFMGSMKLSLGSTKRLFKSAKREALVLAKINN